MLICYKNASGDTNMRFSNRLALLLIAPMIVGSAAAACTSNGLCWAESCTNKLKQTGLVWVCRRSANDYLAYALIGSPNAICDNNYIQAEEGSFDTAKAFATLYCNMAGFPGKT